MFHPIDPPWPCRPGPSDNYHDDNNDNDDNAEYDDNDYNDDNGENGDNDDNDDNDDDDNIWQQERSLEEAAEVLDRAAGCIHLNQPPICPFRTVL